MNTIKHVGVTLAYDEVGNDAGSGVIAVSSALHLERVDLNGAYLERANLVGAHLDGAILHAAHLGSANLFSAHLDGVILWDAHAEDASLVGAHLERANLFGAHLDGANLTGMSFDKASRLNNAALTGASFDQVSFDNTNLTVVDWGLVGILSDERTARDRKGDDGKPKDRAQRLSEYTAAMRANRVLSVALQARGLSEDAARFAYRAKFLQRRMLRLQRRYPAYFGSVFLDLVSGYGYRPLRSFATYLFVVGLFAGVYGLLATLGWTQEAKNFTSWDSLLVLSVTSFHGRVFFAGGSSLGDWAARVVAVEAVFGLLIEISFIATFTQRYLGK